MTNRIDSLFRDSDRKVLSIYLTAGYPELHDTVRLLKALQAHGADMVEIGIPFSDPLADGPVIQQSSQQALRNGMSLDLLFRQLEGIRDHVSIPLILMGYLNPVLQMGMEAFLRRCRDAGIDGVIIPDLPPDVYEMHYREMFGSYGIYHSLLVTPHTAEDRIRRIAELSDGFLYMVAASSTTGTRDSLKDEQRQYFQHLKEMQLPVPGLIGFGISNQETFITACNYARGAIIGSAFIKALGAAGSRSVEALVKEFMVNIRGDALTGSG